MSRTPDQIIGFSGFSPRLKKLRKKALLSYLTQPIADYSEGNEIVRFSNSGLVISWAAALNQLGYEVDIINWDDNEFQPQHAYDLVVIHGGKNFQSLQKKLKPGYKLIYFSAGTYWEFGNTQEEKRLHEFKERHDIKLPHDRFITSSEEPVNKAADGIIGLGNSFTASTYGKFKRVYTINSGNYPDDHFNKIDRDYAKIKDNWLFFAGAGNIHKGLDLVVDAFKDLPQHLYIVTPLEKKFLAAYTKEAKLPNIHFVGETPMRTEKFYEVIDKCAFQILPSCSEGQPGSVIEAMSQGLIPVVSKEAGLDADRYGLILKENSIECIKESVLQMSDLEPKTIKKMAEHVHTVAIKDHSPKKFQKDLKRSIKRILRNT